MVLRILLRVVGGSPGAPNSSHTLGPKGGVISILAFKPPHYPDPSWHRQLAPKLAVEEGAERKGTPKGRAEMQRVIEESYCGSLHFRP